MRITVNGQARDVLAATSVAELVTLLGLHPDGVAVAVNLQVVPRTRHGETVLAEGDAVEVVRAVGGG